MSPPSELFDLSGRVAVVTGAAGLLGREHCRALSDAGAHVVGIDASSDALTLAASEFEATSRSREPRGRVEWLVADVTERASLERVRATLLGRHGRIDVLVNNAAINERVEAPAPGQTVLRFETHPLEDFRRSLDVNVAGVFLAAQIFGEPMARAGRGSIVQIGSTYALVGPDQSLYRRADGTQAFFKSAAYPTSKGAVLSFTRYLSCYWGSRGVRVNALCPGGIANGQEESFVERYARRTPLGRMGRKDELAGALVFLASDASSYVTGATLVVDGGFTAW
jgi:NAD(P)-dependent dehydrogenase (short-subunit alcohol dehydrogenase family)